MKFPGKEEENAQKSKEFLANEKSKEIQQKKKGLEDWGNSEIVIVCIC